MNTEKNTEKIVVKDLVYTLAKRCDVVSKAVEKLKEYYADVDARIELSAVGAKECIDIAIIIRLAERVDTETFEKFKQKTKALGAKYSSGEWFIPAADLVDPQATKYRLGAQLKYVYEHADKSTNYKRIVNIVEKLKEYYADINAKILFDCFVTADNDYITIELINGVSKETFEKFKQKTKALGCRYTAERGWVCKLDELEQLLK